MTRPAVTLILAVAFCGYVNADEITWNAQGNPLEICMAVQNNVRFLYNAWMNGARETYNEMKAYMRATLSGRSDAETRLLGVYDEILPCIESNELAPPNVPDRVVGHIKARRLAGTVCLKAFGENGLPGDSPGESTR